MPVVVVGRLRKVLQAGIDGLVCPRRGPVGAPNKIRPGNQAESGRADRAPSVL